jgi:hypothetical protein
MPITEQSVWEKYFGLMKNVFVDEFERIPFQKKPSEGFMCNGVW